MSYFPNENLFFDPLDSQQLSPGLSLRYDFYSDKNLSWKGHSTIFPTVELNRYEIIFRLGRQWKRNMRTPTKASNRT